MESDSRAYEMVYHITPDVEETAARARALELETLVTQSGGSVIGTREVKKIHLSYPLSHKHYAFFGLVDFTAPADAITGIDAQMKLQEGILRFLITKKPVAKELRTLGDHRARKVRSTHVAPTHKPGAAEPAKPKQEEKVIEKELEDVLEKI